MRQRFPILLSHVALTIALTTSCTPGAPAVFPNAPGQADTVNATADQPLMVSDQELVRDPSVADAPAIASVATLQAPPAAKLAVTEMTQSLQEFLAFDADSTAIGASMTVQSFTVADKRDDVRPEPKENPGKGKAPAPSASPPCPTASASASPSDAGASDVPATVSSAPPCPPTGTGKQQKPNTTVTNPDGSVTRTESRTRSLPGGGSMTESMVRTVRKTHKLVAYSHIRDMVLPNGSKRHQERRQTMNPDGSGTITVTMAYTRADGKTRSLTMTTTITADGKTSRTGTLTRFDGSTVTIAFNGNKVTMTDPATQITVTTGVTPTGTTGTTTVTVGGTNAGTIDTSPSPSPSDSVAPSATESTAPSPTPTTSAASTSPAPSPTPTAMASA